MTPQQGRPLRLLVVGPLPPPTGGVETVTRAVLESSAFSDMEVRHCDTTKNRPKETQGKFDLGNLIWAGIHFARMVRAAISYRPDVIYMPLTATWSGFWRDAVLAWIGKLGRAKVMGHVHGSWIDRILESQGVTKRIVRFCLKPFDALLTLGNIWTSMFRKFGFQGEIHVVPSTFQQAVLDASTNFVRFYDVREPRGLFVGQIGRNKGVLDLLRALAAIKADGGKPWFTIVGGPQFLGDWEEVLRLRKSLGLEQYVEMTGILLGSALYEQFRRTDYFVLPSYFEGLPVVLFEAGSFGLPIVTTNVGSIPDVIQHNDNGLLVRPGDVATLRLAIDRIRSDASLRTRLGMNMKRTISDYEPDRVCQQIADVVKCVSGRGSTDGVNSQSLLHSSKTR